MLPVGLFFLLPLLLFLPILIKRVEENLEVFLVVMGFLALALSGDLTTSTMKTILHNELLYTMTAVVLVAGLVLRAGLLDIRDGLHRLVRWMPVPVLMFLMIVGLGLLASVLTAIIASLLLVEVLDALLLPRRDQVRLTVIACFSIGLGAALTPVGEPLATIVASRMGGGFWSLLSLLGIYVIPCILLLGLFGAVTLNRDLHAKKPIPRSSQLPQSAYDPILRSIKVFAFVVALEMLGRGFAPLIDELMLPLSNEILYWVNLVSAILDNATLAAAEISPSMEECQIRSILMGLLISGGMLVQGNIPNIIAADRLRINSREWAKYAIPIGFVLMGGVSVFLF